MKKHLIVLTFAMTALIGGCAKNQHAATPEPIFGTEESAQLPPMNSETHYAAGLLAESKGEYVAAISQYKESLRLEKKQPTKAMYRLGCVYALLKKYPESVDMFKKYLKATDESAFAFSNLAYAEELNGQPAEAERHYKEGIAKDPSNEPCRINYGLMLARHGRTGEAVIQLQAVLTPAEVHYNLATVYELEHRTEMAKIEYQQALALDPNFTDAQSKLASLGDFVNDD